MRLEKGVITNTQLMFLILSFMEFMVMSVNFVYSICGADAWIAVLAAYAVTMLVAVGYTAIAKCCPGKNLVEINDTVFGPYLGKLFSALYLWFFFEYMIHIAYYFNSFWLTYIMTETPRAAFVILLIFACAAAVRSGIEVIARCGRVFAIMVPIMAVFAAALLLKNMELFHFLPILDISPKDFIQSVHIILTIQFCDIVVFLMILPYAEDNNKIRKPLLIAVSLGAALLLFTVLMSTAVLGARMNNSTSVTFAITREIDVAEVLTRLDVLIAITLLITVFVKIAVFYYATVLGLAQIFKLRSYKPLIVPVGILTIAISANLYPSDMEQVYCARYIWPFNASLFEFILPAITLIAIGLRSLTGNRKERNG